MSVPETTGPATLELQAHDGMRRGDLRPLARLLRTDHPLSRATRDHLAGMIDGDREWALQNAGQRIEAVKHPRLRKREDAEFPRFQNEMKDLHRAALVFWHWKGMGKNLADAWAAVGQAETPGKSASTIRSAWQRHKGEVRAWVEKYALAEDFKLAVAVDEMMRNRDLWGPAGPSLRNAAIRAVQCSSDPGRGTDGLLRVCRALGFEDPEVANSTGPALRR